jgi:cytochrome c-type biogenesis protein CcmH/NrfG
VEKAKALSVIARSFMNEKDYQKAVEYFQQALLEHNNDAVANVLRKAERSLQKQEKKLSLEFGAKALVHFEEQE